MREPLVVARRFNGPPGSGNGGYVCGRVAAAVDAPVARVSLRRPPPLDVPLILEARADGSAVLLDGDAVVAEGAPAEVTAEPPAAPSRDAAAAAATRYAGFTRHAFPTCFVCGPERPPGDGLRIFAGPTGDGGTVAAPWTPGSTDPVLVWAALDCPSAFACTFDRPAVLASLALRRMGEVRPGRPHVVAAWPLGRDGRKHRAASALYGEDGAPLAVAEALWIELRA